MMYQSGVLFFLYSLVLSAGNTFVQGTGPSPQTPRDAVLQGYNCYNPQEIYDTSFQPNSMCATQRTHLVHRPRKLQLLQKEERRQHDGFSCKVFFSQRADYCGVYDHQTNLPRATFYDRPQTVPLETCRQMVVNQVYNFRGQNYGLDVSCRRNVGCTTFIHQEVVGSTYSDGGELKCHGGEFRSEEAGLLSNMIVTIDLKIEINPELFAENEHGMVAMYESGHLPCGSQAAGCVTSKATYVWSPLNDSCPLAVTRVTQGYEVQDPEGQQVFISTDNSLVRLIILEPVAVTGCTHLVHATNYPDFYVVDLQEPVKFQRPVSSHAVSLVSYVKNRDDFLYHHLLEKLEQEFNHVLGADCRLRMRQQQLQFWLQHKDPGLVTWILGNGSFATAAGEVLYHYRCTPVLVRAQPRGDKCYQALPVEILNGTEDGFSAKKLFLEPLTHRLTTEGIVVPCSRQFIAKYRNLNGDWIQASPQLYRASAPFLLGAEALEERLAQTQVDPSRGGLYTEEDLKTMEAYRDLPRAISRISADLVSQTPYSQVNLQDPEALWNLFPNAPRFDLWTRAVDFVYSWGQVAAFMIGLYSIVNILVTIVGWLLRLLSLHRVEGCSSALMWVPCMDLYLLRRWSEPVPARDPDVVEPAT